MPGVEVLRYDVRVLPFRALIDEVFGVTVLEDLHLAFPEQSRIRQLPDGDTDVRTFFHARLYERLAAGGEAFGRLYESLVEAVGRRYFRGDAYVYQHRPSFRVQLPGSLAVGVFHRDRDYNHPLGEINFMVPLTPAVGTSAMWIESEPGRGDFRSVDLEYGEIARFDGNRCMHGNKVNTTGRTRVSFDFRLLSVEDFRKSESEPKLSVGAGLPFTIGGYYRLAEAGTSRPDRQAPVLYPRRSHSFRSR